MPYVDPLETQAREAAESHGPLPAPVLDRVVEVLDDRREVAA